MIKNVALAGRGSYYFADDNENLKVKVIEALGKAC